MSEVNFFFSLNSTSPRSYMQPNMYIESIGANCAFFLPTRDPELDCVSWNSMVCRFCIIRYFLTFQFKTMSMSWTFLESWNSIHILFTSLWEVSLPTILRLFLSAQHHRGDVQNFQRTRHQDCWTSCRDVGIQILLYGPPSQRQRSNLKTF